MESVVKLNRKLGVGGRGVVYEGFDHSKGHFVAIKEMPYMEPSVAGEDDSELAEIVSELACMREAQHPNLVQYYGARRSAVGVQIIMEYVSGGSLDYVLTRCGPLRESVARAYTRDVLQALQYLHEEMHVCHRDVKPANILITPDGRCKLADFGVAKQVEEAPSRLEDGDTTAAAAAPSLAGGPGRGRGGVREGYLQTAVGTPWYMAPEVINGGVEDDEDEDDVTANAFGEDEKEDETFTREYAEACAEWAAHAKTSSADSSLEDWSAMQPTHTTGSPVPAPPPLYASASYYNPLKHIIRKGRLGRGSVGYTTRADIWSVGVTVYEMITGTRPFGADLHNPSAVMFRIANCATAPPQLPAGLHVSPVLQNFLDLCFVYDKNLRATARELLGHPWLRTAAPALEPRAERGDRPLRQLSASSSAAQDYAGSTGGRHRHERNAPASLTSPPGPQHTVFDGVALLDAMDLPPYPSVTLSTSQSMSGRESSSPLHTTNKDNNANRQREGELPAHTNMQHQHPPQQQQQHRLLRKTVDGGAGWLGRSAVVSTRASSGNSVYQPFLAPPAPTVEVAGVTAAEQAAASSRYAAARQRIGHPRTSAPRSPSVGSGGDTGFGSSQPTSGGIQTKYGAFVDLLSHP